MSEGLGRDTGLFSFGWCAYSQRQTQLVGGLANQRHDAIEQIKASNLSGDWEKRQHQKS